MKLLRELILEGAIHAPKVSILVSVLDWKFMEYVVVTIEMNSKIKGQMLEKIL